MHGGDLGCGESGAGRARTEQDLAGLRDQPDLGLGAVMLGLEEIMPQGICPLPFEMGADHAEQRPSRLRTGTERLTNSRAASAMRPVSAGLRCTSLTAGHAGRSEPGVAADRVILEQIVGGDFDHAIRVGQPDPCIFVVGRLHALQDALQAVRVAIQHLGRGLHAGEQLQLAEPFEHPALQAVHHRVCELGDVPPHQAIGRHMTDIGAAPVSTPTRPRQSSPAARLNCWRTVSRLRNARFVRIGMAPPEGFARKSLTFG